MPTPSRSEKFTIRFRPGELRMVVAAAVRHGEPPAAWARSFLLRGAALLLEQPESNGRRAEPVRQT